MAATVVFLAPGTTSWTPPVGVVSVQVECLGPGGKGVSKRGGGGGEYALKSAVPVSPGVPVPCQVGSGTNQNSTWFGSTSTVLAHSGTSGGNGGTGGVGDTVNAGGNGPASAAQNGGTGGGGAAGPTGAGKNGGSISSTGGAGGGGSNGGSSTAGANSSSSTGGDGGAGTSGAGGGAHGAPGTNGTLGGGGGGGNLSNNGGIGGPSVVWTQTSDGATAGPGGGGGGAGQSGIGGKGGTYGGGGGGSNLTVGGAGDGIIVLTYVGPSLQTVSVSNAAVASKSVAASKSATRSNTSAANTARVISELCWASNHATGGIKFLISAAIAAMTTPSPTVTAEQVFLQSATRTNTPAPIFSLTPSAYATGTNPATASNSIMVDLAIKATNAAVAKVVLTAPLVFHAVNAAATNAGKAISATVSASDTPNSSTETIEGVLHAARNPGTPSAAPITDLIIAATNAPTGILVLAVAMVISGVNGARAALSNIAAIAATAVNRVAFSVVLAGINLTVTLYHLPRAMAGLTYPFAATVTNVARAAISLTTIIQPVPDLAQKIVGRLSSAFVGGSKACARLIGRAGRANIES